MRSVFEDPGTGDGGNWFLACVFFWFADEKSIHLCPPHYRTYIGRKKHGRMRNSRFGDRLKDKFDEERRF